MTTLKNYYCSHCGAQLTRQPVPFDYDWRTGERRYSLRFQCPNWRVWKLWHARWTLGDHHEGFGPTLFSEKELWHDAVVPEVEIEKCQP